MPEKPILGKYELGKLLGCGAFAKVYHAREISTGKNVAIKVINKNKKDGLPEKRIEREVRIMSQLMRHPYIVSLYEVMATKTKIYFVMEYVKGGELFNQIANKGRFSEDLSRKCFQQLISAVNYCHSRGIYHRDLKPENILIDENGDIKVSDFGLSATTDQIQSFDGQLHTVCGSPAYVAPEVLTIKGYDGAKTDIWSCGIILYVMIAGYFPFYDQNLMLMYKKIYKGEFRCPKWMSPDVKRILSRLLDVNPATRITIDEIIRDPWFRKGLKFIKFSGDEEHNKDLSLVPKSLNAFDLISFSSGLDISGLFKSNNPVDDLERTVVEESPESIIETIEELAKKENYRLKKKKEWGIEMKIQNICISVDVYRLTESLVLVEVQNINGHDDGLYKDLWMNKLKPLILSPRRTELQLSDS